LINHASERGTPLFRAVAVLTKAKSENPIIAPVYFVWKHISHSSCGANETSQHNCMLPTNSHFGAGRACPNRILFTGQLPALILQDSVHNNTTLVPPPVQFAFKYKNTKTDTPINRWRKEHQPLKGWNSWKPSALHRAAQRSGIA
jgi:hypothetical protein